MGTEDRSREKPLQGGVPKVREDTEVGMHKKFSRYKKYNLTGKDLSGLRVVEDVAERPGVWGRITGDREFCKAREEGHGD